MYIAYNKNSKRKVSISEKPFINVSENVAIAECENIPQKYDYLLVDNIREATRVIKEAYTEEVIEFNEETGVEISKLMTYPQETETYYTCDLIAKFNEYTAEQIEAQKQEKYKSLVRKYVRMKYSQDDVEAINANCDDDPQNEQYIAEKNAYLEYRKECKAKAKAETF